jgi:hypothetical protein
VLLRAVHLDHFLTPQPGGGQPRVDDLWAVGGIYAERVTGRIRDAVLRDVKPKLPHLFS